jgi:hypothetical protein
MKVALVGARRTRNGIGHFIGNYFHRNGSQVVSLLGTSAETAASASSTLDEFGIKALPFTDFEEMIADQCPDAVAIASPSATHCGYLFKSLEAGMHVFCEKPFIVDESGGVNKVLHDIFQLAGDKNLTVAMNSQWPFSFPYYEELCGTIESPEIERFYLRSSPPFTGKEMILESVPHALSLLYCKCGPGTIKNIAVTSGQEQMEIRFAYQAENSLCNSYLNLTQQLFPPRNFSFGFNERMVTRSLDLENYDIYFKHMQRTIKIPDPLNLSVQNFITAVRDNREPFIGKSHIINNTLLLNQIYESC